MSTGDRDAALIALDDLIVTTEGLHARCKARGWIGTAQTMQHIVASLDVVRTKLELEGDAYLPEAWAFVDAGRLTIARHVVNLERRR